MSNTMVRKIHKLIFVYVRRTHTQYTYTKLDYLRASARSHLDLEQQLDPFQWSHYCLAHCSRHTFAKMRQSLSDRVYWKCHTASNKV